MQSYDLFRELIELEKGEYPIPYDQNLQTTTNGVMIDYLRFIAKNDGRTLKWHINKAIETYIQTLGE